MKHTEIINSLIEKNDIQTYCEIGVFNVEHNFHKIKVPFRVGVDPAEVGKSQHPICKTTSDMFFQTSKAKYGFYFLDGLHHVDQIQKDFENALDKLEYGGFILMHDCCPYSEHITHVPRDNGEWTGDVYKFASQLHKYDGIDFITTSADYSKKSEYDYGCTLVWKSDKKAREIKADIPDIEEMTWEYFEQNKKVLLNIISVEEFKNKFLC